MTVGLVQLRCSLIDLQILSRIRFDEAWVGSRGSSKTLMPSKMSVSYLRKSLFDGYSYQNRFLKMDMGTKGPVRITRMDLPVIVELEHLVFVSISIIVLVLAPLAPQLYFDISHCLLKGLDSKDGSALMDPTSIAHLGGNLVQCIVPRNMLPKEHPQK